VDQEQPFQSVNEVFRCTTSGAEAKFTAGPGAGTNHIAGFFFVREANQIAVSPTNHNFYVANYFGVAVKAFTETGEPALFTAGPAAGSNELFSVLPGGVATDSSGNIYVSNEEVNSITVYAASGEELTTFTTLRPRNLSVDSQGNLYVINGGTRAVQKFTPSSFPVTNSTTYSGTLADPGPDATVAVDPTIDDLYVDRRTKSEKRSQILQYDSSGNLIDRFPGEAEAGAFAESEGLAVDGSTGVVYASDFRNAGGERQVKTFAVAPPNAPTVSGASVSSASSTTAEVEAQVNPEHFATRYRFEYLTRTSYEENGSKFVGALETPSNTLGNAGVPQVAEEHLSGLVPETAYVFRVLAENPNNLGEPIVSAVVRGGEGEFVTLGQPTSTLPDGRAYELVSPPSKSGELILPEKGELGGTCEENGQASTRCYPAEQAQRMPMQAAPGGDSIAYEGQPFTAGLSSPADEYRAVRGPSGWSTESLMSSHFLTGAGNQGYKAISSGLSTGLYYQAEAPLSAAAPTRGGVAFGNLYRRAADGNLTPLMTAEPPNRSPDLESEEHFLISLAVTNAGTPVSAPFSHVGFAANDALTAATAVAPAAPEAGVQESDLYEWVNGGLSLVNVLPGNTAAVAGAVFGSGELLRGELHGNDYDHAMSDDGSHIFWSNAATGQVYVRINGVRTEEIEDAGEFLKASADGSKVLLNDGCLYDLEAKSCEELAPGGNPSHFLGILGASDDLSRVYFVDTDILGGIGKNPNGEEALSGKANLYYWNQGAIRFVGVLFYRGPGSSGDNEIPAASLTGIGDWAAAPSNRTAQVTPDGTRVAFMSLAPLTGYRNGVKSGECRGGREAACYEVFEYDAAKNQLSCGSCNPTGQRPLGSSNLSILNGRTDFPALPQPHNLGSNGRLFFETRDALSPGDTNGRTDVYEWEPAGVGTCTRRDGCISLISTGRSGSDSFFVDATGSGDDAFFVTRSQLVRADQNEQLDLYDARAPHVPGEVVGFPEAEASVCSGEGCKSAINSPPTQQSAASSSFSGPGNVKECPKGKKLKKGKCVAKGKKPAKKKHKHKKSTKSGGKKQKRANSNRGGSK
jgi:hypothetical protein